LRCGWGRGQRNANTGTLAVVGRITLNQKPVRADRVTARVYPPIGSASECGRGLAFRMTVPTPTDFAAAPHSNARWWRDCREPHYEGWHSRIAANKVAANPQTKISTHWSRVIRGSIEKSPATRGNDGRGQGKIPVCLRGTARPKLRTFLADRWSLLITRARVGR
jgi:hypothetical protein